MKESVDCLPENRLTCSSTHWLLPLELVCCPLRKDCSATSSSTLLWAADTLEARQHEATSLFRKDSRRLLHFTGSAREGETDKWSTVKAADPWMLAAFGVALERNEASLLVDGRLPAQPVSPKPVFIITWAQVKLRELLPSSALVSVSTSSTLCVFLTTQARNDYLVFSPFWNTPFQTAYTRFSQCHYLLLTEEWGPLKCFDSRDYEREN